MTTHRTNIIWTSEERKQVTDRAAHLLRSNPKMSWAALICRAQTEALPIGRNRAHWPQFGKKEFEEPVTQRVAQLKAGIGRTPDHTVVTRKLQLIPSSIPAATANAASNSTAAVEIPASQETNPVSQAFLREFFKPTVTALGELWAQELRTMLDEELQSRTEQVLTEATAGIELRLKTLISKAVEQARNKTDEFMQAVSAVKSSTGDISAIKSQRDKVRVAYVGDVTGSEFSILKSGLENVCTFVLVDKPAKANQARNCPVVVASNKVSHSLLSHVWSANPGCSKIMEKSANTANEKLMEIITSPDFKH